MSYEIAFTPEDAVFPEESQIAFSTEEFEEPMNRAERRRLEKKAEKDIPMKFRCPNCGYGEIGGPVSTMVKIVDIKTKKVVERRVPRTCRMCGSGMVKLNDRRLTKKWLLKNPQMLKE